MSREQPRDDTGRSAGADVSEPQAKQGDYLSSPFDSQSFHRILKGQLLRVWLLFVVLMVIPCVVLLACDSGATTTSLLGVPLLRVGPVFPGSFGPAIVSLGGVPAIGLFAFGALAIGVIAVGACSFGIVAVGAGSFGFIAVGAGAMGVIAVGGSAMGYVAIAESHPRGVYVLCHHGRRGRYVLSADRQDTEAVRFFCAFLPRLRRLFRSSDSTANIGV